MWLMALTLPYTTSPYAATRLSVFMSCVIRTGVKFMLLMNGHVTNTKRAALWTDVTVFVALTHPVVLSHS